MGHIMCPETFQGAESCNNVSHMNNKVMLVNIWLVNYTQLFLSRYKLYVVIVYCV